MRRLRKSDSTPQPLASSQRSIVRSARRTAGFRTGCGQASPCGRTFESRRRGRRTADHRHSGVSDERLHRRRRRAAGRTRSRSADRSSLTIHRIPGPPSAHEITKSDRRARSRSIRGVGWWKGASSRDGAMCGHVDESSCSRAVVVWRPNAAAGRPARVGGCGKRRPEAERGEERARGRAWV